MSADHVARLDALSKGFRARYLRHDDLTAQMRAWCETFPHLARMQSLGSTPEGRPLWLLTLGPDADRTRPSVWVDGNMHAGEYAGSSVALAIAEDPCRLHLDPAATLHGLTPAVCHTLREVRVFVMPRMSPDGAAGGAEHGGMYARCRGIRATRRCCRGGATTTSTATAWPW